MSWRQIQLDQTLCNQDELILQLFGQDPVKYVGKDLEFAQHLHQDHQAKNLILVVNDPVWCSELVTLCKNNLSDTIENFYIGINRYCIKGNDTFFDANASGTNSLDLIDFVKNQIQLLGYQVTKSGYLELDLGRYFNFVQPLTWLYGHKKTDQSN